MGLLQSLPYRPERSASQPCSEKETKHKVEGHADPIEARVLSLELTYPLFDWQIAMNLVRNVNEVVEEH